MMFSRQPHREAPANKSRQQQLDQLLHITPPHERAALAAIGCLLTALAVWTAFGSVERSATVDGVLVVLDSHRDAVTAEPGHLQEFLVAQGDHVESGDPLARQSVPQLERELTALRDRVALLEAEMARSGDDAGSGLSATRALLAQMETLRTVRELVVSPLRGEVAVLHSVPGAWLPAGSTVAQVRASDGGPPRAVAQVAPQLAQRLRPGMRASIELALPDGGERRLTGTVAAVGPGPLPAWVAALSPVVAASGERVEVVPDAMDLTLPDGTPSRIRIVRGRGSPAALFARTQP